MQIGARLLGVAAAVLVAAWASCSVALAALPGAVWMTPDVSRPSVDGPPWNQGVSADGSTVVGVDQFVQQGAKLVGGPASGVASEGFSVALSDDGNTALIGAPGLGGSSGGAFVFVRSGSTWTQQGPALVGAGGTGEGEQVAVSGDGNTALISGTVPGGAEGGWVFTRTGSTWTEQGSPLVGDGVGGSIDGSNGSVALSDDGNTALMGESGLNDWVGEAFVFVRSGSAWSQQGAPLVADCTSSCAGPNGTGESGSGLFGAGVSLAADGNTALIGAPGDGGPFANAIGPGAAWVFTRSGSTWSQEGAKLVGTSALGAGSGQGAGVALSGDGSTAIINGPNDNDGAGGAAWVFTNAGGEWTQQAKLSGDAELYGNEAAEVALSDDGNTALIGGTAGAEEFTRSGSAWTQETVLTGTGAAGNAEQGSSVALSGDGATALIGGPSDNKDTGAAWVFASGSSPTVALTIGLAGSGSGSVSGSGITCPGTCSETLTAGTMVTLTATPSAGSTLTGWSGGGCSGTATCQLQLGADTTVTATFTKLATFSVVVAGSGSGSVSGSGITCPGTCSETLPTGTAITVTATPAAGSTFAGWSGACTGNASCPLTINTETAVTATFDTPPVCTLKVPSSVVRLSKRNPIHGHHARRPIGKLSVIATCNQASTGTLRGVLSEHLGNRKHRIETFTLGPDHAALGGGRATALVLTLPDRALKDLERKARESVTLTVIATNAGGTGHASARIAHLTGVR